MGKKSRLKPPKSCDSCGLEADTQFRVRQSEADEWRIVCKACQTLAKTRDGYMYGGTWKRKKRN
ncbi:hypothetical protein E5672_05770 [Alteromonas portus]|uniref:Uncharacterized protein n=1 Tax=Alteromonas portus TaxID=2565549 RepID=A0A4U0ZHN7_9ALTE|nr:hypothetical protein E5672_05770 [Alteromonas portus]